ncbi:MAG: hypothetical protein RR998_09080 [Oscillospiraceae bacterium]
MTDSARRDDGYSGVIFALFATTLKTFPIGQTLFLNRYRVENGCVKLL